MAIIKSSLKKSSKRETGLAEDINRLHDLFTNDGGQVISSDVSPLDQICDASILLQGRKLKIHLTIYLVAPSNRLVEESAKIAMSMNSVAHQQ